MFNMKQDCPIIQGKFLGYLLWYAVLVMGYKCTVVQVLEILLHFFLERFFIKPLVFWPVSSNSDSNCSWKSLVFFFLLNGFLGGGASHEVTINIFWSMVWEYYGCPEPCVGEHTIDMWNEARMSQDHLVNRGNCPWCALELILHGQWLFTLP